MWAHPLEWLRSLAFSGSVNWKLVFFSSAIFDLGFKTLLDIRQLRVQYRTSPPEIAVKEGLTDEKTFKRSQEYSRTKLKFGLFQRAFECVLNLSLLASNALPNIWQFWAGALASKSWAGEKCIGILFALTFAGLGSVLGLPFDYYQSFVIEEKFGFNKSTVALWVKDTVKSWIIGLALMPPLLAAIQAIIVYFGQRFVPYLMLFTLIVALVANILYPVVLDPWFNKYENLEKGELRTAIEELAASLNFPLGRIYVVDGSTRSSHSNAYFIGFPWYKQIVIYDTLIKSHSTDEIVAVLAHELGHWKRNHISVLMSMSMVMALINYFPLGLFLGNDHFFQSLGFPAGETPVIGALLVYIDTLAPLTAVLTFVQNYVTRACEYDADRFAVNLGKSDSLRRALIELNKSNLSTVDADKLYSTFHHSHPIITERLRAIQEESKKRE